jgi:hypothetical protein
MIMPQRNRLSAIAQIIIRIIFLCLALLPFALGALAAADHFSDYGRYRAISLLAAAVFFMILFAMMRARPARISEAALLISVFVMAVLVRALSQAFFNTEPISDYMDAVNAATAFMQGPVRSLETARFPYWGFYRITLSALFRVFGATISTIKNANLLLSGLTAVSIYLLGKRLFSAEKFGLIAALIFIFDPANILYINLATGEHIFVLLYPIAMLLYLALFGEKDRKGVVSALLGILLGLVIGLMDMYKPIAPIILTAMLIALALSAWPAEGEKKERIGRILRQGLLIIAMLGAYYVTKEVCFSTVAHYAQIPPNRHGIGWTLRVGLDLENRGRVSAPLAYEMSTRYHASGEDYRTVNAQLVDEALEQIQGKRFSELFRFAKDKFSFTWQSNQDFYNWASNSQMENGWIAYDAEWLALRVNPLIDAVLTFTLALSSLGAFYNAWKDSERGTLAIGLFILGFTLLLFATEVQQRYRSVLAPAMPFFAAYGLYAIRNGAAWLKGWMGEMMAGKEKS